MVPACEDFGEHVSQVRHGIGSVFAQPRTESISPRLHMGLLIHNIFHSAQFRKQTLASDECYMLHLHEKVYINLGYYSCNTTVNGGFLVLKVLLE
jgi:hypothetical protein